MIDNFIIVPNNLKNDGKYVNEKELLAKIKPMLLLKLKGSKKFQ
jgi:hypothetical protein